MKGKVAKLVVLWGLQRPVLVAAAEHSQRQQALHRLVSSRGVATHLAVASHVSLHYQLVHAQNRQDVVVLQ